MLHLMDVIFAAIIRRTPMEYQEGEGNSRRTALFFQNEVFALGNLPSRMHHEARKDPCHTLTHVKAEIPYSKG